MVTIVFTVDIGGHFLEYIHHLYDLCRGKNGEFVFLLPASFEKIKNQWQWEESSNVLFELFDNTPFLYKTSNLGQFILSYKISKLVQSYIKKYKAKALFSLNLTDFVPSAPLVISKETPISGIVYKINIDNNHLPFKDRIYFSVLSKSPVFSTIMILNDEKGAAKLNEIFGVNKFVSLPDPYIPLKFNKVNVRNDYLISEKKTLFVHFGAMNTNKATIDILESLYHLSIKEKEDYSFFFAGRVQEDIKDVFYKHYEALKYSVDIHIIDSYCSYDFFASLCLACDAILIPYRRVYQSSGIIGYASQFNKPVIAPNKGLLGQLVKEYKLGCLIEDNTPDSLIAAYKKISNGSILAPTNAYCEKNSIEGFQKTIGEIF